MFVLNVATLVTSATYYVVHMYVRVVRIPTGHCQCHCHWVVGTRVPTTYYL